MPKVEYSKAKGLVQSTGSGFVMAAETVTAAGAADPGVALTLCDAGAGSINVSLADGTTVGQLKWFVTIAATNNSVIIPATTAGAYANVTLDTLGESLCLVWAGAAGWAILSRAGGAAAAANAVAGMPAIA